MLLANAHARRGTATGACTVHRSRRLRPAAKASKGSKTAAQDDVDQAISDAAKLRQKGAKAKMAADVAGRDSHQHWDSHYVPSDGVTDVAVDEEELHKAQKRAKKAQKRLAKAKAKEKDKKKKKKKAAKRDKQGSAKGDGGVLSVSESARDAADMEAETAAGGVDFEADLDADLSDCDVEAEESDSDSDCDSDVDPTRPGSNHVIAGNGSLALERDDGPVAALSGGRAPPPDLQESTAYVALSEGMNHTLALTPRGTVQCFGSNAHGEAPFDEVRSAMRRAASQRVVARVRCRWLTRCARLCMNVRAHDCVLAASTQVVSDTGSRFQAVSAGLHYSLALREDGSVACWGRNSHGQAPPEGGASRSAAVRAGLRDSPHAMFTRALRACNRHALRALRTCSSVRSLTLVGANASLARTAARWRACAARMSAATPPTQSRVRSSPCPPLAARSRTACGPMGRSNVGARTRGFAAASMRTISTSSPAGTSCARPLCTTVQAA